jgi:hydrogenase nickel incorporation protein HypA/HybF
MHEYSLVQSLLAQIETLRRQQRADRVVSVHLSVGEFAGVEPELLRHAFELQTTAAWDQPVELTMDIVPLEAECQRCKHIFHVEDFHFECAHCQASEITVCRGEDLILDTVTFEQTSQQSEQQLHEQSS